ncbi:hypothetical protein [Yoonia sp.]|uniref:hypothetical protein n=1 Tax=Yoonia sp. TaxID=2212373 RepID=UPI0025D77BCC|nr:hypothetical protein [Yoonia sp.]
MTKKDRTTLKAFFRDGALPTAEHYRDLIDSGVNQIEDGFSKTPTDGLRLTSVGGSVRMISLYEGLSAQDPAWIIDHGKDSSSLHFKRGAETAQKLPGISFSPDGRLGVKTDTPEWRLDVDGVQRSRGRIGFASDEIPHIPADSKWHDITDEMTGCQAFDVMAGVGGDENAGRYSMVHAIAMNAYHPRNWLLNMVFGRRRIRAQTAMYGSYADRIRLRWVATPKRHHFKLQMRTNADFGKDKVIRYYLTRLWFDPKMEGSRGGMPREAGLS